MDGRGSVVAEVTVRYWAAARDAAGRAEERITAETLAAVIETASGRHGPGLATVLGRCAFLVDDEPVSRRDPATVVLRDGCVVEALPPFAGG